MATKYGLQLVATENSREYHGRRPEVLDDADLSLKLGTHTLFEVVVQTPQGWKNVTITSTVSKAG